MTTITEIFRTFSPEYLQRYGEAMPVQHKKVINAIIHCRTEHYGTVIYTCEQCGTSHILFQSCGNRHCPTCQNHKTKQWVARQMMRQVPGHHFMITFTLPQQLRDVIRSRQRIAYQAMFKASSETLKTLAADTKYIGGDMPGFFGVLHTWGRKLQYHPHIHYIAPGGAFSKKDYRWHPSRLDFYVPVKALSKIFKAKFRDEMKREGLLDEISSEAWDQPWNVNSQAVGTSERSIKYLAPYVFKVAISQSRIVKIQDQHVFFRYRKDKSNRWRTTSMDGIEFIRRFLQHVLPAGFMKVRYYGFLNATSSIPLDTISALIELSFGFQISHSRPCTEPLSPLTCPECGGMLRHRLFIMPAHLFPDRYD